jgi:hypothetical protein
VDVTIALLASQTEQVETLGWNDLRECAPDAMYEALDSKIGREIEVLYNAFFVRHRSDERIAE